MSVPSARHLDHRPSCSLWRRSALAALLMWPAMAAPAAGQPRIHVDQPMIDLGKLPEGQTGEVIFALQNQGDAPLEILDATTTCTCVQLEVPQRVLEPGERLFIPARYVTTGHAGKESGAITLTTNDPLSPRTQLVITVDIDAVYEMEPLGQLRLQPQRPGLPCEPALKLLPRKPGERLVVLDAQSQAGHFEARRQPYERDGRVGEELVLVGLGSQRRGTLTDALVVSFRAGDTPKRIRIPVHLPLLGELSFSPNVLVRVNTTWRGRGIGKISVESLLGRPMEILSATADGPVAVSTQAIEPKRRYEVAVRVAEDAPPGPFGAMVTIVTDLPGESLLQVPVYGNVYPYVWRIPEAVVIHADPAEPKEAKAEVRLMWPVTAPVQLGDPEADDPRILAELVPGDPQIKDGMELATAAIRITLAADVTAESIGSGLSARITLPTAWEQEPAITIPVFVRR